MDVRSIVGVLLAYSLVVVPLGAQGHSGGPHGNPHAAGAPQGPPPTAQGPKSPNPAGHTPGTGQPAGAGHPEGAGQQGAGHVEGQHGPMTVSQHLAAQPQLSQRLQGMLPAGVTVDQAAAGFKNLGQFVAAVNVSHNVGIPFDQLKAQMTGASPVSLGEAIHTLKPGVDAKAEVQRAEAQARDMTRAPKK